jgi:succinate dehydrogenase / fumarate reductase flavoprotein subunit
MGKRPSPDAAEFQQAEQDVRARLQKLLDVDGTRSLDSFHRELGLLLWDMCGMSRHEKGLREALRKIPELRSEFWSHGRGVRVLGSEEDFNQSLERAGRVADFLEFAELMCIDALERDESAGAHFREEHQTSEGEARRDDENHAAVFAWEFETDGKPPKLHREPLHFETVHLTQRSYK